MNVGLFCGSRCLEATPMSSVSRHLARLVFAALLLTGVNAMAAEEPRYDVLSSTKEYEIRRYEPYIVAETDVEGPYSNAGNKAFNILAGYIFGKNRQSEKMAMTVPVESRPADKGVRMAMTAPVTSRPSDSEDGVFTYAFVMERKYTLDTLPEPVDSRIRIREVPSRIVAVHRFSGSWGEENYQRHEERLRDALERDGIPLAGVPYSARYNAPFVPSFLRRNEVIVPIDGSVSVTPIS